ncbi:hypothetical protein ACFSUD_09830 [Sulfitobacter aestuarii]|uniref:DUF7742 domain-containing protein n=1 Tax=Sulfitobacter aestuarii TaxID=2161676 RepID=A0ABW5U3D0_9RHOB
MRAVLHSDLIAAARALLLVPRDERPALCETMLREADWADRFTRRLGRMHPLWGNGTLLAAARRRDWADEPRVNQPDYCACLLLVLQALAARRGGETLQDRRIVPHEKQETSRFAFGFPMRHEVKSGQRRTDNGRTKQKYREDGPGLGPDPAGSAAGGRG